MAYNLEPLVQILHQILHPNPHHPWILHPTKKPEIESLLNKAHFMRDFFEKSAPVPAENIKSLENRITNAAHELEDILESRLVDQIQSTPQDEKFTFSPQDNLEKVSMEFNSIEEEIKMMTNQSQISGFSSSSSSSSYAESSRSEPNPKNILVGFHEDLLQLKDRATNRKPKLEIIPIVGMGGIGKTTLARNVYDDPLVTSHFDIRAWITVSQDYNLRRIILGLLQCVAGNLPEETIRLEDEELAVRLYQSLCGRRYMIVLDDMWDSKAWDGVRRFLPNENHGSRILITTRELNVASHVNSSNNSHHNMHFLNIDDSWDLLCQKIFAQENCPSELEDVGRTIAANCGGLPLAVHLVGGVLSHAKRSQEFWCQVARDVSSAVASEDEQFSQILSLSYNHLPVHLKPCFLYMAAFPEDYEIRTSKLTMLWEAEGFVKPIAGKSLEEAGEMYMKALIDRNLFLVRHQDTNGNVKSCSIHDLLRDLCTRKAHEEKLFFIKNPRWRRQVQKGIRRVSTYSSYAIRDTDNSMKHARSFLFIGSTYWVMISEVVFKLKLLRVLDILEVEFNEFPEEVLQLFNLRYLALSSRDDLSNSSICLLCNLQTLIFLTVLKQLQPPRIQRIFVHAIITTHQVRGRISMLYSTKVD